MTTPQKVLRPLIHLQILRHSPKPIHIETIYSFLNSVLEWDSNDLTPPTVRGKPVAYPSWKRNVRNVLQQDARKGIIQNTIRRSGNYVWGNNSPMSWHVRIIRSFDRLGNELTLEEIYADIQGNPHRELSESWKAIVRGRIETHSSDSDAYAHGLDLFYSVSGKGQGVWGLRNKFHHKFHSEHISIANSQPPPPRKGRSKSFIDGETIESGWVYVIHNTSWPGWIKVGKAAELESRMRGYRTYEPNEDAVFEYLAAFESPNALTIEEAVHTSLEARFRNDPENKTRRPNSEWYKTDLSTIIQSISDNWIGERPDEIDEWGDSQLD
tara:strand:+ start:145 stop:1119 length:975 start_codon:yes stop_codon:yes gene_type:complete